MTGRLDPVPLFFGMQLFLQNWSTVQPSVLVNSGSLKQGTSAHVQCRYFQRAGDGVFFVLSALSCCFRKDLSP